MILDTRIRAHTHTFAPKIHVPQAKITTNSVVCIDNISAGGVIEPFRAFTRFESAPIEYIFF